MNKPYKNIVTDKLVSFTTYMIISEYETQEEATKNYKTDVKKWQKETKEKYPQWYKIHFPFGYATIKENSQ